MVHISHQSTPALSSSPDAKLTKNPRSPEIVVPENSLAQHSFAPEIRISLDELSKQAKEGVRKAIVVVGVLALNIGLFSTIGTYAFNGFSQAQTWIGAGSYLALIAADLWLGLKICWKLVDVIDYHFAPSLLLAQAKKEGGVCNCCEYPLKGLESPRCPECGEIIEQMRKEIQPN